MASEYYLDGVPLDDPAGRWFVTSETTLPTLGAPRNVSTAVPWRSGVLPQAPLTVDPLQVTVKVVVQDSGRGREGLDTNYWALMRLVRRVGSLITMQHRPPGGTAKQTLVRLSNSVEPVFYYAENMIEVTLVFEGVEGVWWDERETTVGLNNLSTLMGSAMPITRCLIDVETPTGAVVIRDVPSGGVLSWSGTVPKDVYHMVIDVYAYRVVLTDDWWKMTGTDASGGLSQPPGGWALTPDAQGRFSVTTSGAPRNVRFRCRRAY